MPTDQPDGSDLRERVADLEATVSDQQETIEQLMPSRRQALVGAGLLGGGLLGGRLSTGTARAQAAGQVGTDTDPVDVQAWGLDVQNGAAFNGNPLTGVGALDVEQLSVNGDYLTAVDDADLDQKIAEGKHVSLVSATYSDNRQFSDPLTISGIGGYNFSGSLGASLITGNWTWEDGRVHIENLQIDSVLRLEGSTGSIVQNVFLNNGSIEVASDQVRLSGISRGSVTFESGTSEGIIDSSAAVTVTDNGTNIIGDIS